MTVLLAAVLTAAPLSIAAPGITCARIEKPVCDSFLDRFVTVLGSTGRARVITGNDISQLIGLERQKQLLGCSSEDSASCLAELANALGVDGVISLSVVKSDPSYIITTRIVRVSNAQVWQSATERADREGEVYDRLDAIAGRFANGLADLADVPGVSTQSTSSRLLPFVPGAVGIVAGAVGLGVFLSAGSERGTLMSNPPLAQVATLVSTGRTKESAGVGLWITGAVLVAASIVWLVIGSLR